MPSPDRMMLVVLLLVAAALRFSGLGREELWLDEAHSADLASRTVHEIVEVSTYDNKPPLYFVVLRAWLAVTGDSEAAVRSMSAAFGVLVVAVMWLLGSAMVSPPAARVAATLLALHPLAVHYSREARNYSLLFTLVLLALLALARSLTEGRRSWWATYAASFSCALFVHYIAVLLVPVFALQLALDRWREKWRDWAAWTASALVPLVAWVVYARRQKDLVVSSLSWFEPFWDKWHPLEPFGLSLLTFVPGGVAPPWVGLPASSSIQPLVVLSGIVALSCFLFHHQSRHGRVVILGCLFLPLAQLWLGSHLAFPVYVVGRADQVAFPGALLLMGASIADARTTLARSVTAVMLAASTLAGLYVYFDSPRYDTESPVLRPFVEQLEEGDLVVCTGFARLTAEYAIKRSGRPGVHIESFPSVLAFHPAAYDPRAWSTADLVAEAAVLNERLRDTRRNGRHVYVLLFSDKPSLVLGSELVKTWLIRPAASYRLKRAGGVVQILEVVAPRQP